MITGLHAPLAWIVLRWGGALGPRVDRWDYVGRGICCSLRLGMVLGNRGIVLGIKHLNTQFYYGG